MQTQRVNIRGVVVWITILQPTLEMDGRISPADKYIIYYNFFEPKDSNYGKIVCSSYGSIHEPVTCNDMDEAIKYVGNEIDKRFFMRLGK